MIFNANLGQWEGLCQGSLPGGFTGPFLNIFNEMHLGRLSIRGVSLNWLYTVYMPEISQFI
jgi:hypothetical protein